MGAGIDGIKNFPVQDLTVMKFSQMDQDFSLRVNGDTSIEILFDGSPPFIVTPETEFPTTISTKRGTVTFNKIEVRLDNGILKASRPRTTNGVLEFCVFDGVVYACPFGKLPKNMPLDRLVISFATDLSGISWEGTKNENTRFLSTWDTSSVTSFKGLFQGLENFNENLGHWDTSKVETFDDCFHGCRSFNAMNNTIGNWSTESATSMSRMFKDASLFNPSPLSPVWETGSVTDMSQMFDGASSFTGWNLEGWDVSSVKNMFRMFGSGFVCRYPGRCLEDWDVSSVENMDEMFCHHHQCIWCWKVPRLESAKNLRGETRIWEFDVSTQSKRQTPSYLQMDSPKATPLYRTIYKYDPDTNIVSKREIIIGNNGSLSGSSLSGDDDEGRMYGTVSSSESMHTYVLDGKHPTSGIYLRGIIPDDKPRLIGYTMNGEAHVVGDGIDNNGYLKIPEITQNTTVYVISSTDDQSSVHTTILLIEAEKTVEKTDQQITKTITLNPEIEQNINDFDGIGNTTFGFEKQDGTLAKYGEYIDIRTSNQLSPQVAIQRDGSITYKRNGFSGSVAEGLRLKTLGGSVFEVLFSEFKQRTITIDPKKQNNLRNQGFPDDTEVVSYGIDGDVTVFPETWTKVSSYDSPTVSISKCGKISINQNNHIGKVQDQRFKITVSSGGILEVVDVSFMPFPFNPDNSVLDMNKSSSGCITKNSVSSVVIPYEIEYVTYNNTTILIDFENRLDMGADGAYLTVDIQSEGSSSYMIPRYTLNIHHQNHTGKFDHNVTLGVVLNDERSNIDVIPAFSPLNLGASCLDEIVFQDRQLLPSADLEIFGYWIKSTTVVSIPGQRLRLIPPCIDIVITRDGLLKANNPDGYSGEIGCSVIVGVSKKSMKTELTLSFKSIPLFSEKNQSRITLLRPNILSQLGLHHNSSNPLDPLSSSVKSYSLDYEKFSLVPGSPLFFNNEEESACSGGFFCVAVDVAGNVRFDGEVDHFSPPNKIMYILINKGNKDTIIEVSLPIVQRTFEIQQGISRLDSGFEGTRCVLVKYRDKNYATYPASIDLLTDDDGEASLTLVVYHDMRYSLKSTSFVGTFQGEDIVIKTDTSGIVSTSTLEIERIPFPEVIGPFELCGSTTNILTQSRFTRTGASVSEYCVADGNVWVCSGSSMMLNENTEILLKEDGETCIQGYGYEGAVLVKVHRNGLTKVINLKTKYLFEPDSINEKCDDAQDMTVSEYRIVWNGDESTTVTSLSLNNPIFLLRDSHNPREDPYCLFRSSSLSSLKLELNGYIGVIPGYLEIVGTQETNKQIRHKKVFRVEDPVVFKDMYDNSLSLFQHLGKGSKVVVKRYKRETSGDGWVVAGGSLCLSEPDTVISINRTGNAVVNRSKSFRSDSVTVEYSVNDIDLSSVLNIKTPDVIVLNLKHRGTFHVKSSPAMKKAGRSDSLDLHFHSAGADPHMWEIPGQITPPTGAGNVGSYAIGTTSANVDQDLTIFTDGNGGDVKIKISTDWSYTVSTTGFFGLLGKTISVNYGSTPASVNILIDKIPLPDIIDEDATSSIEITSPILYILEGTTGVSIHSYVFGNGIVAQAGEIAETDAFPIRITKQGECYVDVSKSIVTGVVNGKLTMMTNAETKTYNITVNLVDPPTDLNDIVINGYIGVIKKATITSSALLKIKYENSYYLPGDVIKIKHTLDGTSVPVVVGKIVVSRDGGITYIFSSVNKEYSKSFSLEVVPVLAESAHFAQNITVKSIEVPTRISAYSVIVQYIKRLIDFAKRNKTIILGVTAIVVAIILLVVILNSYRGI